MLKGIGSFCFEKFYAQAIDKKIKKFYSKLASRTNHCNFKGRLIDKSSRTAAELQLGIRNAKLKSFLIMHYALHFLRLRFNNADAEGNKNFFKGT